MAAGIVAIGKFVGTTCVGLLTGLSYTTTFITLPSLLTLPSAPSANRTFTHFRASATRHIRTLTEAAAFCFLSAFLLSPRTRRHPYLLWTTAALGATQVLDFRAKREEERQKAEGSRSHGNGNGNLSGSASESGDWEGLSDEEHGGDGVNGEEVRNAMERYGKTEVWRTAVSGVAFVMSVVGIWGEKF